MKTLLKTLIVVLILQSCTSNTEKDKLIGNWSTATGSWFPLQYEFYKDSVIISEMGDSYINDWNINENKLHLKPINGLDSFGIKESSFNYKLSKNQDTIFIKRLSDSLFKFPILKIKNAFDYLQKQNQLSIDLPKDNELIAEPNQSLGINIYFGFRSDELVAKSNDYKHKNLENLKLYCYEQLANNSIEQLANNSIEPTISNLHFNFIADKNIPVKKLDSVKNILKETGFENIFRIYTNLNVDYNKTDWKDELVWYGKME